VNEYKNVALHSTEKPVYRAQQTADRWKITLMDMREVK
jgi:hypothetical protein